MPPEISQDSREGISDFRLAIADSSPRVDETACGVFGNRQSEIGNGKWREALYLSL